VVSWTPQGGGAAGFRVHIGKLSKTYDQIVDVGLLTQLDLSFLDGMSTYYIAISAYDAWGNEKGFSEEVTVVMNVPPAVPQWIAPPDQSVNNSVNMRLVWKSSDPDFGSTIEFDVYLDTVNPPVQLIAAGQPADFYAATGLDYDRIYYWKIVARDNKGAVAPGPVWQFRTFAAADDADGDGFTNQEEIDAGSDPFSDLVVPWLSAIHLKKGFNLIAIPADVMFMPDLRDWLPVLGTADDIEKVMVYDPVNHRFVTLVLEAANNPAFSLSGGEALIVYAKRAFDVSFTSALCGPMDLRQGLNVTGFACPPDGYTAFDLLNALGAENVISIQRFDTDSGTFETAGFNESLQPSGVDFSIVSGEGYLIQMQQPVIGFEP
jgi:hypothetical protein